MATVLKDGLVSTNPVSTMQENVRHKALSLFQQGQYDQARELYETILASNPNDAEVLYMIGSIYANTGDFKNASLYFRKTTEAQPGVLIAYCGLGASHKAMGEYVEAENAFQQALKIQPGNTDILIEVASLNLLQDKINEAEALLKQVLLSDAKNAEALHGMGEIARARNQFEQAENYFLQAISNNPAMAKSHNHLGLINHRKGLLEPAIEHYKKAIAIDANNAESWKNLAQSQLLHGNTQEALESVNRAIILNPDDINAVTTKAGIYEKTGEAKIAYETIKPLLDKNVLHTGLAAIYTSICQKLDICEDAIKYLERLTNQPGVPASALESVNYVAGKLFDKLGDFDRAFSHYEAANKARSRRFRPAEYTAVMDAIKRVFDWGFISATPKSSTNNNIRPIFIIGMPRSGTSLVEQILDSHPAITGAGELTDIETISVELANSINPDRGFPFSYRDITPEFIDHYAKRYLDKLSGLSSGARYVTDKMPQNFVHLGLISILFPDAKIVHCVRNPMDTCLSIYFQNFNESHEYATHLDDIVYYYKEYRRLMDHWKSVLQLPIHDIHYEDLVSSPKECIEQLLSYLGVNWDDNCLMFHTSSRHVATASYDQVKHSIYSTSLDRWKNYQDHVASHLESLSQFQPGK